MYAALLKTWHLSRYRKGSEINKPADLTGKSLVVPDSQSSYDTTKQLIMINKLSSIETRAEIRVDSVGNTRTADSYRHMFPSMRRLFSPGPVARIEIFGLHFRIPISAVELSASFADFVEEGYKTGLFNKTLTETTGLRLSEYRHPLGQR